MAARNAQVEHWLPGPCMQACCFGVPLPRRSPPSPLPPLGVPSSAVRTCQHAAAFACIVQRIQQRHSERLLGVLLLVSLHALPQQLLAVCGGGRVCGRWDVHCD